MKISNSHQTSQATLAHRTRPLIHAGPTFPIKAPPLIFSTSLPLSTFSISGLMISEPSNISTPSAPLVPNQLLFVPVSCACNSINATNLTTYQSVEAFNPDAVPTHLDIDDRIVFPIFCKCPNETQIRNGMNYLVTYVFQPFDTLSEVASRFWVRTQDIIDINDELL
ncbi:hypothetical protein V6N13_082853 [Hibiscus sabdariffa]